jgi:hypothetical protein
MDRTLTLPEPTEPQAPDRSSRRGLLPGVAVVAVLAVVALVVALVLLLGRGDDDPPTDPDERISDPTSVVTDSPTPRQPTSPRGSGRPGGGKQGPPPAGTGTIEQPGTATATS